MTIPRFLLLAFVILIAGWLQAALSIRIEIFHARPDFLMTTMICVALLTGTTQGTLLSLWAGYLTAVLAAYNYGSIIVSRLLTGVACSWLQEHLIQDSPVVPPIAAFLATWLCEGFYFLMDPNIHHLHWWLHLVVGESVYNTVLAVPIYFLLKSLKFGVAPDNGFSPYIETF